MAQTKKKSYSEKLRDPRWQKRRLEILERDEFTCQRCQSTKTELHVHHWAYSDEPWNVNDEALETLCKYCHLMTELTYKGSQTLHILDSAETFIIDGFGCVMIGLMVNTADMTSYAQLWVIRESDMGLMLSQTIDPSLAESIYKVSRVNKPKT